MALLAGLLACSMTVSAASGQSNREPTARENPQASQPAQAAPAATPSTRAKIPPLLSSKTVINEKASTLYRRLWGIDDILVRQIASGALIRFSFRVVDPDKAKALNEKNATPSLIDEGTHAALQIPVMEQVGQLRQTANPEKGREYWMVFSNNRRYVKPGNRVDIVIGRFRIDGLVVQ